MESTCTLVLYVPKRRNPVLQIQMTSVSDLLRDTLNNSTDKVKRGEVKCPQCNRDLRRSFESAGLVHLPSVLILKLRYTQFGEHVLTPASEEGIEDEIDEEDEEEDAGDEDVDDGVNPNVDRNFKTVDMKMVLNVNPFCKDRSRPAFYMLQSIVKWGKKGGQRDYHRCITRTPDDEWWMCDAIQTLRCTKEQARGTHTNLGGYLRLLFYEKI